MELLSFLNYLDIFHYGAFWAMYYYAGQIPGFFYLNLFFPHS